MAVINSRSKVDQYVESLPTQISTEPKNLRALPNLLLSTKLKAQNFEIREAPFIDADPPADSKSLVSHSYLNQLQKNYLTSSCIKDKPWGSLLFCLIAFDLVLSTMELKALFTSAIQGEPMKVGQIVALEAEDDGRPVVQRLVSNYTTDCLDFARRVKFENPDQAFDAATAELHKVLHETKKDWKQKSGEKSVTHLAMIASHWAALEIPQGTLYGVFHKAPFIPTGDIARIHYGQPRIGMPAAKVSKSSGGKSDREFKSILKIVKEFSDKDDVLGNDQTRSKDCIVQLRDGQKTGALVTDFADDALIDLLCEDLSADATYRQLKINVLGGYARKYEIFFEYARCEGSLDLDAEAWGEIYTAMDGSANILTSDQVRWAMLHLAHFLHSRGHWAPSGLLSEKAVKKTHPPRSPTYTTHAEIKHAVTKIGDDFIFHGGSYSFTGSRLALQRGCPSRVSEIRYARPRDIDLHARLFHITASGHNHLKSDSSKGSIQIPESLLASMKEAVQRREKISVGTHTLLFCDSHLEDTYEVFDFASTAITTAISDLTGCPKIRQHDLRVAATTDIAFELEVAINKLANAENILQPDVKFTADSLAKKHTRFALASRNARHACVLTSLRYYVASGTVDLKCHLDVAHRRLFPSGKYEASRIGSNAQAVFAAKHRLRSNKDHHEMSQFENARWQYSQNIATPNLAGPTNALIPIQSFKPSTALTNKLASASLMNAMGLDIDAAADAVQISQQIAKDFHGRLIKLAKVARVSLDHKDDVPVLSSVLTGTTLNASQQVRLLVNWILTQSANFQKSAARLPLSMDQSGSRLNFQHADDLLNLIPLLEMLPSVGVHLYFRTGQGVQLSENPQIVAALTNLQVSVHAKNGKEDLFGVLSFAIPALDSKAASKTDPKLLKPGLPMKVSPRSLGRGGRLVIRSFLIGLLLTT